MISNVNASPWAYIAMAAWLSAYAVWDIYDGLKNRYKHTPSLVGGAVLLLLGICICAFLELRGPLGA